MSGSALKVARSSADARITVSGGGTRERRRGLILGSSRQVAGFTLLEILVVVVIIGVMVSVATISVGVLGKDREAQEETERFWAVVQQAREEAELQSRDVAIFVSATAYEFLRFDRRRDEWQLIGDDNFYAQRELPEGLRFRLWLDSREVVLKPSPPERGDKDQNKKWPPQIMVLSSGDIMPFELHLERDSTPALWRVLGMADNDLRLERRQTERDWVMVAQTKPPPVEKDKAKERFSDAR